MIASLPTVRIAVSAELAANDVPVGSIRLRAGILSRELAIMSLGRNARTSGFFLTRFWRQAEKRDLLLSRGKIARFWRDSLEERTATIPQGIGVCLDPGHLH